LLKRKPRRLQRHGPDCATTEILRERSGASTKYFVAGFVLHDVFPDGFYRSGKINAQTCVSWFAQSSDHWPYGLWCAFDEVPVVRIDRDCVNLYQDLVVIRNRLFNLLQLEIGHTIIAINDGLHRIGRSSGMATVVSRSPVGDKRPDECQ